MLNKLFIFASSALAMSKAVSAQIISIASVNNGDMITMKELSTDSQAKYPDINHKCVPLCLISLNMVPTA